MPRGKWTNHKGRGRHFTNPEALEEERRREEAKKARDRKREYREEGDSSSENEEEEEQSHKKGGWSVSDESEGESESDSESEPETKGKGVEKLIEISNPNRVQKKTKKLSTLNESLATSEKPELSRREREELEKQAAEARHQKLHAEGRTEEARADLARLAIIKAQREEAAMKRKLEKLQKEELLKSKQEAIGKALGKRT